jgi:O-antigen biosynthesis protein WbqV
MTVTTVLIGSATALRAAAAGVWGDADGACAVVVGGGKAPYPIIAQPSSLNEIDCAALPAKTAVLCERPDPAEARALLARSADAKVQLKLIEDGTVRDLALRDVIGAAERPTNAALLRQQIAGRRVLITGGGGSIGSELARKIAGFGPSRLTLLDSSECNLYKMGLELPQAVLALADVRDVRSVQRWFEREMPDVVFHTAALKQVPLVEAFPCEGVLTNLGGLRNVAEAAQAIKADLVFVSTDKAVDPTGVMGASKRLGELFCQAIDRRGGPRAVTLRLGNVLGSAGSVAPVFEAQAAAGKPLTITDSEVTRFFLSIPQAADALLAAARAALAGDAPRGAVLVIDMGEPLPILELARAVIRLAGKRPDVELPIVITGLRPGERLHEQLISAHESIVGEAAGGVTAVTTAPRELGALNQVFDQLLHLASEGADAEVKANLFAAMSAERYPAMAAD